jgi:N-methylhydantoinase B/oxoprolinase/acetone carboxylase alpha subunit
VRELEFRKPLVVSILSERRAFRPFGLAGGDPGAAGRNTLLWLHGSRTGVSLGGKSSVSVEPGDRLRVETPGGGGYGAPPRPGASGAELRVQHDVDAQSEEYAQALAAATGGSCSTGAAALETGAAASDAGVGAQGAAPWAFAGSLGSYRETHESA